MDEAAEIPPNPKVDAIIADITHLMDDVDAMLRDSTSHHAENQVELLRERCGDMRSHLAAFCASAGEALTEGAQRTDRTVRAHPYQSLALALGAGVLLGVVLARGHA